MIRIVVLVVHHLGQTEIGDFDLATDIALGQQNVARLQIVMDDRRFNLI